MEVYTGTAMEAQGRLVVWFRPSAKLFCNCRKKDALLYQTLRLTLSKLLRRRFIDLQVTFGIVTDEEYQP